VTRQETEAERLERLDREACRAYRVQRYSGGKLSKRYRLDMEEAARPATSPTKSAVDGEPKTCFFEKPKSHNKEKT
jgi:hypothetical protein